MLLVGPSGDHTTGKTYYLYIETSAPRKQGDQARLNYNFASPVTTGCFTAYYHMFGSNVGELRVVTRATTSGKDSLVWRKTSTQGDKWNKLSVTITQTTKMVRYKYKRNTVNSLLYSMVATIL